MLKQKPPESLEGFALIDGSLTPLFFADLINGIVEGFNDMKTIQDQGGVRAVFLDCPDVGLAHVTTGPRDLLFLIVAELFGEEFIDGFTALSMKPTVEQNPMNSAEILFDRPFFYVVRDDVTDMILALGRIIRPLPVSAEWGPDD